MIQISYLHCRYLFGPDLSGFLQKDDFVKLQVQNFYP